MFRLLVAGGRDYYDYRFIDKILTEWLSEQDMESQEITLVHGDAAGVDRIAAQWAKFNDLTPEPHPADWKNKGRAAGVIRNEEMIRSGIDYAILFPGGIGTANMKKQLMMAKIEFREVLDSTDKTMYTR
jgi:SLOG family YspA-like protein